VETNEIKYKKMEKHFEKIADLMNEVKDDNNEFPLYEAGKKMLEAKLWLRLAREESNGN
jgi:hypothetical protein